MRVASLLSMTSACKTWMDEDDGRVPGDQGGITIHEEKKNAQAEATAGEARAETPTKERTDVPNRARE